MRQIAIEIIHAECYTGNPSPSLLINHYHDIAESDRVTVAAAEAVERTITTCVSSKICRKRVSETEVATGRLYDRRLPDYEF